MIRELWKIYQQGKRRRAYAKEYYQMYKDKGSHRHQELEKILAEKPADTRGTDVRLWVAIILLLIVIILVMAKYLWLFALGYLAYIIAQKKK